MERTFGRRKIEFSTVHDFTKVVVTDTDRSRGIYITDTTLYGYGWIIFRAGGTWKCVSDKRWYQPSPPFQSRTRDTVLAYCRTHPATGCRYKIRPSEPIEDACTAAEKMQ